MLSVMLSAMSWMIPEVLTFSKNISEFKKDVAELPESEAVVRLTGISDMKIVESDIGAK